ncbi:hypothetical protein LTR56_010502 [Elasticomyces elasticus]|nr:hypothetical protein LTR56_010502 [Elasticomyces elasticus]KAK3657918.1 hypothetical protein LTR22_009145 [Elasticomyces elasticus]KAK4917605.1 hypothetical protein LTR49_014559 [Elasticomyces elasticus]KAK5762825.1 hypothetical protein LTS12_007014 [Elasticomyces elasticus]
MDDAPAESPPLLPTFRHADVSEDELLARILYNAFLPNWDMNWWQNLGEQLKPVPLTTTLPARQSEEGLSTSQSNRLDFYRSTLTLVRLIGGTISVVIPPGDPLQPPGAVICWLPPGISPTPYALLRSGFLLSLLRFGGIVGTFRFLYFEYTLAQLYSRSLIGLGYASRHDGAFVQIVATSPACRGQQLSARLLQWQIEQHRRSSYGDDGSRAPVFLDTTGDYQQRVYEGVGFRELGRRGLGIEVDGNGLKLKRSRERSETEEGLRRFVQRVMILESSAM